MANESVITNAMSVSYSSTVMVQLKWWKDTCIYDVHLPVYFDKCGIQYICQHKTTKLNKSLQWVCHLCHDASHHHLNHCPPQWDVVGITASNCGCSCKKHAKKIMMIENISMLVGLWWHSSPINVHLVVVKTWPLQW